MNNYDPHQLHHRRSIRLQGYDYSQEGLYFVTVCVQNRLNIFGKITCGVMKLNENGKMIEKTWLDLPNHNSNIILDIFCIMPNHFHAIIEIIVPVGAGSKPARCDDYILLILGGFGTRPYEACYFGSHSICLLYTSPSPRD